MGLQLTISALMFIGASWLFGGIAEDVMTGDPLTVVDVLVAHWLHDHATPEITKLMLVITHVHGPTALVTFTALMSLYLLWKRDWYWLAAAIIVVPVGMLLNVMMKHAFQRTRPHFDDPLLVLTTYSFPSGHVAGATLFYGLLTAYVVAHTTQWRWRVAIALLALLMVVSVALSRMYLGVHYLSDVLAAFAEGFAWVVLCLTALNTWRHTAARR
ncbi:MAG: phosphatase PAP2 family protein [Casimicrobiaceae bacterium]